MPAGTMGVPTAVPRHGLTGCTATQRLLDTILAVPDQPIRAAVCGPGGTGKTAFLAALASHYQVPVRYGIDDDTLTTCTPVLVDDAHLLDDLALLRLRQLAAKPGAQIVLTCRPWPRPPELTEVLALCGSSQPLIRMGHLDYCAAWQRIAAVLGNEVPEEFATALWRQSGGLPLLIDRVLEGLLNVGTLEAITSVSAKDHFSTAVSSTIDEFRADFDQLSVAVNQVLLTAALGGQPVMDLLTGSWGMSEPEALDAVDAAMATGFLSDDGSIIPLVQQAIIRITPEIQLNAARDRLAAQLAKAAILGGDLDDAHRLAEQAIARSVGADRSGAVTIAATIGAHRGLLAHSAELYRWAMATPDIPLAAASVPTLIGTGMLTDIPALLSLVSQRDNVPPTALAAAESLIARGLHETMSGDPVAALSALCRAVTLLEPTAQTTLMPDTPAALAALVAMHCGELEIAESIVDSASICELGGRIAVARHHLLRAWAAMLRDDALHARTLLDSVLAAGPLQPRDELFATALSLGLARRNGDLAALSTAWGKARKAVLRHPVDLYSLLPLGECLIAAAKLAEQQWLAPQLVAAQVLLERLGRPVLWSAPLHWAQVQAAIATGEPIAAKQHVSVLAGMAAHGRYPSALAAAARCWLQVLAGKIDPDVVLAAGRGLQAIGLPWDGARLIGQAAIRTTDRKAMGTLLNCARGISSANSSDVDDDRSQSTTEPGSPSGLLSARERDVAELVLDGLTYKQIGERLFITAKTVEHHVARMRQRLDCSSRAELLARLRLMVAERHEGDSTAQGSD